MADKHYITSADEILGNDDLMREEVDLAAEGWGGAVFVREFTAEEADEVGRRAQDPKASKNLLAQVAARVIVTRDGEQIFAREHESKLARKSFRALRKISDTAQRLSGMTKEVREALGNGSAETSADASPSA